jgi:uncharacterized protein YqgV (UPF0045/DUF77 family)
MELKFRVNNRKWNKHEVSIFEAEMALAAARIEEINESVLEMNNRISPTIKFKDQMAMDF